MNIFPCHRCKHVFTCNLFRCRYFVALFELPCGEACTFTADTSRRIIMSSSAVNFIHLSTCVSRIVDGCVVSSTTLLAVSNRTSGILSLDILWDVFWRPWSEYIDGKWPSMAVRISMRDGHDSKVVKSLRRECNYNMSIHKLTAKLLRYDIGDEVYIIPTWCLHPVQNSILAWRVERCMEICGRSFSRGFTKQSKLYIIGHGSSIKSCNSVTTLTVRPGLFSE